MRHEENQADGDDLQEKAINDVIIVEALSLGNEESNIVKQKNGGEEVVKERDKEKATKDTLELLLFLRHAVQFRQQWTVVHGMQVMDGC